MYMYIVSYCIFIQYDCIRVVDHIQCSKEANVQYVQTCYIISMRLIVKVRVGARYFIV